MVRTYLGGRVVAARWVALLALGDLIALLVFAVAGATSHGESLPGALETALQFGVGWAVVATAAGAYGHRSLDGVGRSTLLGAGAWVGAAAVGALVRAVTEPGAGISPVFVAVTAGVGAVVFGAWRAIAAWWL